MPKKKSPRGKLGGINYRVGKKLLLFLCLTFLKLSLQLSQSVDVTQCGAGGNVLDLRSLVLLGSASLLGSSLLLLTSGILEGTAVRENDTLAVLVELEEGVDGLIHISDLSWTKKVKHPSEFTQVGAEIEVIVLDIDKENRRLSLGHKQLEDNPWDVFEAKYTVGSIHEGKIIELLEKGAVVQLDEDVEGFATPKHLQKEDGSQAQAGETLEFKVIEFNKDSKRIILSHSRTFEDPAREEKKAAAKKAPRAKKEETPKVENVAASTTLGDLDVLAQLKAQMEKKGE